MRSIAVIAETSAELPLSLQQQLEIVMLPHTLHLNSVEYIEGENIDPGQLRALIRANQGSLTTSAVNPGTFLKVFNEAISRGQQVLAICLPPRFSCTIQNAVIARDICASPQNVHIFDGRTIGFNLGKLAVAAAQLCDRGLAVHEIIPQLNAFRRAMFSAAWLADFSAVASGGRVTDILKRYNSLLQIQPVMGLTPEGNPVLHRLTRTLSQGIDCLIDLAAGRGIGPNDVLCIGHLENQEGAARLLTRVRERWKDVPVVVLEGGNLLYIHMGAGVVSLSI